MTALYIAITFLLSALIIAIILIFRTRTKLEKSKRSDEASKKSVENLLEEIRPLKKFQCCVNAEKEAQFILSKAHTESERLIQNATYKSASLIEESKKSLADTERLHEELLANIDKLKKDAFAEAKEKVASMELKAKDNLSQSLIKASEIIKEAEDKANQIAGEAYEIAKNADYYKELASAMKNIVKGYGDEYLKPTESILDSLSEEYSFTEAGNDLKSARIITSQLVSDNLAATCDYVEQNRRETAIAFVLDAFNGKVDSIMSLIKKDNYGILEQKIKDAYAVVNHLGKPFRNARILPQYLSARLSELKWGVAVMALKMKDKEEQRAIKERIREEERARREYEKAIKDAAKQEEIIRKAMDKARAEIEKASEEQRAKYEAQLSDLETKLAEAEAKSQRAISLAQQTKSGHVYIISNIGSFGNDVYKIGMTRRLEPLDRVRELGDASVPFPFDVHAMIYSEDAPTLETELHKIFASNQVNKVNPRKEFFRLPINHIKEYIEKKGVNAHWTIQAEAAQYRETLALEKSFKNDKKAQAEWETRQDTEINDFSFQDEDD